MRLRREGDGEVLGIVEPLDAEAAADVRRRHPHRLVRQAELVGELLAQVPHALPGEAHMQPRPVPFRKAAARLQRHAHHPVVDQVERHRVQGRVEDLAHRPLVAERPVVGEVLRGLLMDRRAAHGGLHVGGQVLEVADDQLDRVHRLRPGLRHHHGDRLAGVARHVLGQHRAGRIGGVAAVAVAHDLVVDLVVHLRAEIGRRDHRHHAGRGAGLVEIERRDPPVRDRAAEEGRMQRPLGGGVVEIAARSGQEPHVLLAPHRLTGSELAHHCPPMMRLGPNLSGFALRVQSVRRRAAGVFLARPRR